ncbi:MAG: fumarylacetoacetate hydrolase family protein [Chloroflexota bacterium]|nr:fumarylacetoacetate hydrolase family protein [Chloroflexota bacterium]
MRYYRMTNVDGDTVIGVEAEPGSVTILTDIKPDVSDIRDLILAASLSGAGMDEITMALLEEAGEPETVDLSELLDGTRGEHGDYLLDRPIDPPEVWAVGVTYKSSEMERRRESSTPDVYAMVYQAERPELFFKSTADRCVGPFEDVGIRADSPWNVPEPELAFTLYKGEIVGYTIGNDMSSRAIEGENPLYLAQAKLYDRSCAIGPCFIPADDIDPQDVTITCRIDRDGETVFTGETSTSQMARTCRSLADWLLRHNSVPDMTTVLTGTAIVPPPDFTLEEGDVISITIDGIGTLENGVVVV